MTYQIKKTGEMSYEVMQGDLVHMRDKGPVEGRPPPGEEQVSNGSDLSYAVGIAARAVRFVRKVLPRGAFNNQMCIEGEYRYLTNNVAPKWLAARAETMYASLAYQDDTPRDTVTQMAARSLATRSVKGGVCSLMAYVTAGYLTTIAQQGTRIAAVFDASFDHEYVVVSYGSSPYVVADPWVGRSYVCLWEDCFFPPDDVNVHTLMEMEKTLSLPYGVEFSAQEVRNAVNAGGIRLIDNPPENQKLLDPDKQSLDQQNRYQWFHMDSAYAQPDNLKAKAKKKYRSVVGPETWGEAAAPSQPSHTKPATGATDYADMAATQFPDEFY